MRKARTFRLFGGPCDGQTFTTDDPRASIEAVYIKDEPRPVDPWDQTYGQARYLARMFVHQEQTSREQVHWRKWRAYLWSNLPADDTTSAMYRDQVTLQPVEGEGWRAATQAELARWDYERQQIVGGL